MTEQSLPVVILLDREQAKSRAGNFFWDAQNPENSEFWLGDRFTTAADCVVRKNALVDHAEHTYLVTVPVALASAVDNPQKHFESLIFFVRVHNFMLDMPVKRWQLGNIEKGLQCLDLDWHKLSLRYCVHRQDGPVSFEMTPTEYSEGGRYNTEMETTFAVNDFNHYFDILCQIGIQWPKEIVLCGDHDNQGICFARKIDNYGWHLDAAVAQDGYLFTGTLENRDFVVGMAHLSGASRIVVSKPERSLLDPEEYLHGAMDRWPNWVNTVISLCLTFHCVPELLPPYVMLEVLDWFPTFYRNHHVKKINLILGIYRSIKTVLQMRNLPIAARVKRRAEKKNAQK